ncbi:GNAT family N-acetyltransferase [Halobacillus sp. H74]|uniref:GNAT family N-acetyltransferase n=1 Tax=Halobacillus sp. H74 TaxID=3457436 RepID=UPI003FCE8F4F
MEIVNVEAISDTIIRDFLELHWGSTKMVVSSGSYDCTILDGFAALNDQARLIGLVTYIIDDDVGEIISLDSIVEGEGIGTSLIQSVEKTAMNLQCRKLTLITTNDNLAAIAFYQKRGFRFSRILHNAVEQARKIKPEIPMTGNHGIPIIDEIEMTKRLNP